MNQLIRDSVMHFILMCVYVLCPPFYLMALTYLLSAYRGVENFIISDVIFVFWQTIWIPAFCGFLVCLFLQFKKNSLKEPAQKRKDYPIIFILFYSIYFVILGRISWGSDCMYGGLSGLLLVFFGWLFRDNLRKCVVYLPATEKIYAYMIVFLFPVFVLLMTDILSFIQQSVFSMTILISPIAYIGGISVFLGACMFLRAWCAYYHEVLKKNLYTLQQLILLILIGDNFLFLYLISYIGNMIFIVGFTMSILLFLIEYLYGLKRRLQ